MATEQRRLEDRARRVLVAHDFSAGADAAALAAAEDLVARGEGGTLVLLHVYDVLPLPAAVDAAAGAGAKLVGIERAAADEHVVRLERVAERLRRAIRAIEAEAKATVCAIEVEVVVRQGTPTDVILEAARELETSRIVMGTHGRRGLAHMLLGSVAERVARSSGVPVLVVPTAPEPR